MIGSVRMRLTFGYVLMFLLIIVPFAYATYTSVKSHLMSEIDRELSEAMGDVARICRYDPRELVELEIHSAAPLFQVLSGEKILYRTKAWDRKGVATAAPGVFCTQVEEMNSGAGMVQITVARDQRSEQNFLRTLRLSLLLLMPLAGLMAVVNGAVMARRVMEPIGAMAAKARHITVERLSARLPIENPKDEFGQLALAFNGTFKRLQSSFEQLRRFTSDASHELRTPLSAIRSVGEVALQQPRDAAAYRDVIGSMLEEVDRLARLVEGLLTLTRADAGIVKPERGSVDAGALATGAVDLLRVLAEEKGQTLDLKADRGVTVEADAEILRQAVVNVIDNAVKYTPNGGEIHVEVRRDGDKAVIEVRDSGPGIAAEHRARIFDRFYRADTSRVRETGGSGLGLAIAKWAAEINGGTIEVSSEEGLGSIFRIKLPLRTTSLG